MSYTEDIANREAVKQAAIQRQMELVAAQQQLAKLKELESLATAGPEDELTRLLAAQQGQSGQSNFQGELPSGLAGTLAAPSIR